MAKKAIDLSRLEIEVLASMRLVCGRLFSTWADAQEPITEVNHSLEGVRCNGTGRKASMMQAVEVFANDRSHLYVKQQSIAEAIRDYETVLANFYDHFKKCPECEGRQGTGQSGKNEGDWCPEECWHDCLECNGKGYIAL